MSLNRKQGDKSPKGGILLGQDRGKETDQKGNTNQRTVFPMQTLQVVSERIILRQGTSPSEVFFLPGQIPLQNGLYRFYLGVGIADKQNFAHGEFSSIREVLQCMDIDSLGGKALNGMSLCNRQDFQIGRAHV